jgi:hypothetical protein
MDLLAGIMLNFGPAPRKTVGSTALDVRSEFGSSPNILFLEWKYYF